MVAILWDTNTSEVLQPLVYSSMGKFLTEGPVIHWLKNCLSVLVRGSNNVMHPNTNKLTFFVTINLHIKN